MTIIPAPDLNFLSWQLTLMNGVTSFVNNLTGRRQNLIFPESYWALQAQIRLSGNAELRGWRSFLSQIRTSRQGSQRAFYLELFDRLKPAYEQLADSELYGFTDNTHFDDGTYFIDGEQRPTATASVSGAHIAGDSGVNVAVVPEQVSIFREGHYISINDYLYLIETASMPSSGVQSITIHPPLRIAAADGDRVEFEKPRSVFWLEPGIDAIPTHGLINSVEVTIKAHEIINRSGL